MAKVDAMTNGSFGQSGHQNDLNGPAEGNNDHPRRMKMKFVKIAVLLFTVVALLAIAMPAAAQAPACPNWLQATNLWFIPTGCSYPAGIYTGSAKLPAPFYRAAGTNEDPFGGLALTSAKFGTTGILPGGVPSDKSGDGTSPRKAIYIGGAWDTNQSVRSDIGETPKEIPACTTLNVPAGTTRWAKADSWSNKKLQFWLDDELATAKAPSGSAVFGAADLYMSGLNGAHPRAANAFDSPSTWTGYNTKTGPEIDGFVVRVYDGDNLQPNYFFDPPNARILTTNVSGSGSLRRQPPNLFSGMSGVTNHGYATFNPNQPNHLLWYETHYNGWVFFRVYNQMIWDQVVSLCTYRATTDAPADH